MQFFTVITPFAFLLFLGFSARLLASSSASRFLNFCSRRLWYRFNNSYFFYRLNFFYWLCFCDFWLCLTVFSRNFCSLFETIGGVSFSSTGSSPVPVTSGCSVTQCQMRCQEHQRQSSTSTSATTGVFNIDRRCLNFDIFCNLIYSIDQCMFCYGRGLGSCFLSFGVCNFFQSSFMFFTLFTRFLFRFFD